MPFLVVHMYIEWIKVGQNNRSTLSFSSLISLNFFSGCSQACQEAAEEVSLRVPCQPEAVEARLQGPAQTNVSEGG